MVGRPKGPTGRKSEVLEASYQYLLQEGIGGLSLRPLAAAVGSSAGVLLYLFDSKHELVRALLARAREDELTLLATLPESAAVGERADLLWRWLSSAEHRPLLRLWVQAYGASLMEPEGPWAGFAQDTWQDWLDVLAAAQPARRRQSKAGVAERTLTLAVLRGAMLDLLASGDQARTTAAVRAHLAHERGQLSRRRSAAEPIALRWA